ncbi:MAG: 30S ribosomal protein S16 [Pseudomonadota bacterium]
MLIIRLTRHGAKKAPFYHVTVADRAAKRDGRFVERVGFYNPVSKGNAETLRIDLARIDHWMSHGAKPSETVAKLISKARKAAAAEAPAAAAETA